VFTLEVTDSLYSLDETLGLSTDDLTTLLLLADETGVSADVTGTEEDGVVTGELTDVLGATSIGVETVETTTGVEVTTILELDGEGVM